MDALKESIAKLSKDLPVPIDMTVKHRGVDFVQLHFKCADTTKPGCLYPGPSPTKTFYSETKELNKWLKVGIQAVTTGYVFFTGDVLGGMERLKGIWDDATFNRQEDEFNKWATEPFLTSEESDKLIKQLRSSNFFDKFKYEPKCQGWICSVCAGKTEPGQTDTMTTNDNAGKTDTISSQGNEGKTDSVVPGDGNDAPPKNDSCCIIL